MTEVGLFAIAGIQHQGPASSAQGQEDEDCIMSALHDFARCVGAHGGTLATSGDAVQAKLHDGTRKTTVATITNGTQAHGLPTSVLEFCPEFAQASKVGLLLCNTLMASIPYRRTEEQSLRTP